jgi:hypothetical protein
MEQGEGTAPELTREEREERERLERNRRLQPRVERPPVSISGVWGEVLDISLTGISVTVERGLEPGMRLDLVLMDTRSAEQRWIEAEVMWSDQERAGLRWIELTAEDQEWLVERFSSWLEFYREALRVLQLHSDPTE